MGEQVDISTVIVTFKSRDCIRECILSLYQGTRDLSCEIIIVDNGSGDGLPDFVRHEFPNVTVLENEENEGFARAVNRGASMATGRYLAILNPDTRLYPETLKTLLSLLEKDQNAVVGPRAVDENGRSLPACRSLPHIGNIVKYPVSFFLRDKKLKKPRRFLLDLWTPSRTVDVTRYNGYLMGTCLVTSLDLFKKMGMFDPLYFLYCEDADFGFRIKKGGCRAFLVSEATLIHLSGRSADQNPLSLSYFVAAYLHYLRKNLSPYHRGVYEIFLFLYILARALKTSWKATDMPGASPWKSLSCFLPWKTEKRGKPFREGHESR